MQVADLILPVFAVILTGWLAGCLGYVGRDLSDALIHFAYNVAMPALLIVTIAHEPARSLLAWRFLIAFGGGSLLCFAIVFASLRGLAGQRLAGAAMQGWAASMTNTGFVALPVLQATYGSRAVLPAAIATVFVAVVMFPTAVLMQELDPQRSGGSVFAPGKLAGHVILNPMVLSTLIGVGWAAVGVPLPGPLNAYLKILADALTACALFAIGLGVSMEGLRANIGRSAALAAVKLGLMPLIVLGLSIALKLEPLYLIAAVVCAAVPTAKTVYILSGEYHCEEATVAATISLTTLCSIGTLVVWIYLLTRFFPLA
ncbi:MAG TPA: AEC family transporter [Roseiarcus sp.]|nr:AEC family transporter [Roseiarcus sp.]